MNTKKKWPCRRLGPLIAFLSERHPEGLSLAVLASELGMSPHSLSAMMNRDNMRLSRAEAIAQKYGFTLMLNYVYTGCYPTDMQYTPSQTVGNLYGIEEYCVRMKRTVYFVSQQAGCSRNTVTHALSKGDIMLDELEVITEALGINVKWVFRNEDD